MCVDGRIRRRHYALRNRNRAARPIRRSEERRSFRAGGRGGGLWCDEQNKVAEFEPVGTQPAHRRKGLATAVMTHALHRMRSRGMRRAVVNTGDTMQANHLYEQVMGPRRAAIARWTKELPA